MTNSEPLPLVLRKPWLGAFLIVFSPAIIIAIFLATKGVIFALAMATAFGKVIKVEDRMVSSPSHRSLQHNMIPEIEFKTQAGEKITFWPEYTARTSFAPGDVVEVKYNLNAPSEAVIVIPNDKLVKRIF